MQEVAYTCSVCGSAKKVAKGKPIPLCCHQEMETLASLHGAPETRAQ